MKKIYTDIKASGPARVIAIVVMVMVWILIDKGNIYGQSVVVEASVAKAAEFQVQSQLLREGADERVGGILTEEEGGEFVVKPNPVSGDLVFDFEFTVREGIHYEVMNPLGKLVESGLFQPGLSTHSIDFSRLKSGMYLVRLDFGSRLEVRRIIRK